MGVVLDRARWLGLCDRMEVDDAVERFEAVSAAYAEPHRHYHTAAHVVECLEVLDEADVAAEHPDEVEVAVWMHDVVYRPARGDNEERSAELAARWLAGCVGGVEAADRVRGLIAATDHRDPPRAPDGALVQDVDLHVLGAPEKRFAEYERQIRAEYRFVPSVIFRRRRAAVLSGFLARQPIYTTAWFRERFEARARVNLTAALDRLAG